MTANVPRCAARVKEFSDTSEDCVLLFDGFNAGPQFGEIIGITSRGKAVVDPQ